MTTMVAPPRFVPRHRQQAAIATSFRAVRRFEAGMFTTPSYAKYPPFHWRPGVVGDYPPSGVVGDC
jgi:hypothetical protein